MTAYQSTSISALYFDYRPAVDHEPSCPRKGTNLWEVTRWTEPTYSWSTGDPEHRLRLACHECHVLYFENTAEPNSREVTHAGRVGYGASPDRVAGVYLWPGPELPFCEDRGPQHFLITAAGNRPARPEDCLGIIGWNMGPRGGTTWGAGAGMSDHGRPVKGSGETFPSRTAAVKWVIANATDLLPVGAK